MLVLFLVLFTYLCKYQVNFYYFC